MNEILIQNAILATAIDTDGSIFAYIHKHGERQKPSIGHTVSITNNNIEFLEKMQEYANIGTIIPGDRNVKILWIASKKDVKNILERIIPFLIIKKKQANKMLDYCNKRLNCWSRYSEEDWSFVEEMKKLNGEKNADS